MTAFARFTALLALALACGDAWSQEKVQALKPTQADIKYGPAERNVLDFYQAKSEQPTPLVIYIHGGGFVGGNKNVAPGRSNSSTMRASVWLRFITDSLMART